ncbi:MAG: YraN family protein [Candidatus Dactylopiibacterium sp.]|nr:YraN family protein [Candidatus Dactylopiibacterium sp.]
MSDGRGISAAVEKLVDCLTRGGGSQALSAGTEAERFAERELVAQGARVLARNARCRGGELDLVVAHAGYVAFVEVRLRRRADFGGAAASITPAKQRRLIHAAQHWLLHEGRAYARQPCRFDAVLLDGLPPTHAEWLQGAFEAEPC